MTRLIGSDGKSKSDFVRGMLQDHRDELATEAQPEEMDAAMKRPSF